ncbi:unnamed protein product [Didymodactylos carnosus]|uniref:Phosphatidylinositol-glycan biosynthesis class X protein n=1 Tax=Didymodactylos carnosus TaxID=1234261 RepID=A0A8S2CZP2_9BILA|nr:unnamed protein product [Didymodactylos carnosus]CAF3587771.1 unnamed protein product [Didymodactylos carnosus]
MLQTNIVLLILLLCMWSIQCAPTITSRIRGLGYHKFLDYYIEPDINKPAKCLFVWHRLPEYLYVDPEDLYRLNATIMGTIDIESSASNSHPFVYCFVLYNSTDNIFRNPKEFSVNIHIRYLDPVDDNNLFETLLIPEPVIHFTAERCPYLGAGCPPPLPHTGIESPKEVTATIPVGLRNHLWFVKPISCIVPVIGCVFLMWITLTSKM